MAAQIGAQRRSEFLDQLLAGAPALKKPADDEEEEDGGSEEEEEEEEEEEGDDSMPEPPGWNEAILGPFDRFRQWWATGSYKRGGGKVSFAAHAERVRLLRWLLEEPKRLQFAQLFTIEFAQMYFDEELKVRAVVPAYRDPDGRRLAEAPNARFLPQEDARVLPPGDPVATPVAEAQLQQAHPRLHERVQATTSAGDGLERPVRQEGGIVYNLVLMAHEMGSDLAPVLKLLSFVYSGETMREAVIRFSEHADAPVGLASRLSKMASSYSAAKHRSLLNSEKIHDQNVFCRASCGGVTLNSLTLLCRFVESAEEAERTGKPRAPLVLCMAAQPLGELNRLRDLPTANRWLHEGICMFEDEDAPGVTRSRATAAGASAEASSPLSHEAAPFQLMPTNLLKTPHNVSARGFTAFAKLAQAVNDSPDKFAPDVLVIMADYLEQSSQYESDAQYAQSVLDYVERAIAKRRSGSGESSGESSGGEGAFRGGPSRKKWFHGWEREGKRYYQRAIDLQDHPEPTGEGHSRKLLVWSAKLACCAQIESRS